MGTSDGDIVKKVSDTNGYIENLDMTEWEMRLVGKANEKKKRPSPRTKRQGDSSLRGAKNLKPGGTMARIYLEKDVHSAIGKEQARMSQREKDEKKKTCSSA